MQSKVRASCHVPWSEVSLLGGVGMYGWMEDGGVFISLFLMKMIAQPLVVSDELLIKRLCPAERRRPLVAGGR